MSSENSPYRIHSLKSFDKTITIPSSKSHSNRALILGAIKGGNFKVHNISASTDVTNLLSALKTIGLKIKTVGTSVVFENSFPACENDSAEAVIDLHTGDGGTTNRFLIALLARGKKEYRIHPTEKMSERPIEDLINPLKKIDVAISQSKSPWITIKGPASLYNTTKLDVDCEKSTQFASALMLAFSNLPLKFNFLNLHASEAYLKMTSYVLKKSLEDNSYTVPVDFSSLGYPIALAALLGRVHVVNAKEMDQFQADSILIELLKKSGAEVLWNSEGLTVIKGSKLKPLSFKVGDAPDLFPTLIFLAAHIDGESIFSDLKILQYKESDRLKEMLDVMKAFSVDVYYDPKLDLLKITGSSEIVYPDATIHSPRDHRIVMSSALFMAKNSGGNLFETDCIEKSFPNFLSLLE